MTSRARLRDELARDLPRLRTSADEADQVAYARDLWPRHHLAVRAGQVANHRPALIAWPSSTEEVAALVRWAGARRVPLVPFGAGSGVCGGVLPDDETLVVDMKRMARWRALDRSAPSLTVEAGELGLPMEEALGRHGFTLGHFPSSILCSTVGGWLATRSAGQCSGLYGKIEDMVMALECVTGAGEIVQLARRTQGPNLVPLVVGSEGTLAIVTAATLRLHPAPTARVFATFTVPTLEEGWNALRTLFQEGLRPAVSRLYDPFDAALARRGKTKARGEASEDGSPHAPGLGSRALPHLLRHPKVLRQLTRGPLSNALGPALLVLIFEDAAASISAARARAMLEAHRGTYAGEEPARRWFAHRYAVSYRQAPVYASGAFVDTFEVAAPWSRLANLYEKVHRALSEHAFVMAHFSHAYADGCCIYFTFAGSAGSEVAAHGAAGGWDEASMRTYDLAWSAGLRAAVAAGGTISHHHGVGRSKAPRLGDEIGGGLDVLRAVKRAFDPHAILNPGALFPIAPRVGSERDAPTGEVTS